MGHKMGLNGVDNAKITFSSVRTPISALLNRLLYSISRHYDVFSYMLTLSF